MDISEVIAEAVEAALPAPAEEVTEEAEATPEAAVEDSPEAEAAPLEVEAEAEPEEPAPDLPDGFVAVPTVKEKLATEFALFDKEGELEVPDLTIEYKANGKVRRDRLDQVVKLAQWGVYNEERVRQVEAVQERAAQIEYDLQQYAALVEQREQQIERLLQDDDFFYSVREAYERENSPDRRAERAEQELQNYQIQSQVSQIAQVGEQFYQAEVEPAIGMITQAFPTLNEDEVSQQLARGLAPILAIAPNGEPYVPVERYQQVRDFIVKELAVWANMVHTSRYAPVTERERKAQVEAERARVEAQKAKRSVGRATQPVGRAARDGSAPKQKSPVTIDDALDSAINSVLSSIR